MHLLVTYWKILGGTGEGKLSETCRVAFHSWKATLISEFKMKFLQYLVAFQQALDDSGLFQRAAAACRGSSDPLPWLLICSWRTQRNFCRCCFGVHFCSGWFCGFFCPQPLARSLLPELNRRPRVLSATMVSAWQKIAAGNDMPGNWLTPSFASSIS